MQDARGKVDDAALVVVVERRDGLDEEGKEPLGEGEEAPPLRVVQELDGDRGVGLLERRDQPPAVREDRGLQRLGQVGLHGRDDEDRRVRLERRDELLGGLADLKDGRRDERVGVGGGLLSGEVRQRRDDGALGVELLVPAEALSFGLAVSGEGQTVLARGRKRWLLCTRGDPAASGDWVPERRWWLTVVMRKIGWLFINTAAVSCLVFHSSPIFIGFPNGVAFHPSQHTKKS